MKMVGLGRLRWYCTPCDKQCRNENAFKQHTLSESHVRRIQNIGNVNETINNISQQFQAEFLDQLRTSKACIRTAFTRPTSPTSITLILTQRVDIRSPTSSSFSAAKGSAV